MQSAKPERLHQLAVNAAQQILEGATKDEIAAIYLRFRQQYKQIAESSAEEMDTPNAASASPNESKELKPV